MADWPSNLGRSQVLAARSSVCRIVGSYDDPAECQACAKLRPLNFLIVVADQLSPRALPPYGNQVVHAPAIGRLAESGAVFEHAYCNFPLCAPSRASFMTGRLASRSGVYDNGAEFPASVPTLAHRLRAAGYRTCLAGKMHFIGPDQLHGFEQRLTPDIYPAGMHWIPDWTIPTTERLPWYHDMTSVFEAGPTGASLQRAYDEQVASRSARAIHDLATASDGQPFLLVASFSQPHDPWESTAEHWQRYDGVEIDLPRVAHIPDEQVDPHTRRVREMCGAIGVEVPEPVLLNARRSHYASISWVDDVVADLVGRLDAERVLDDTVVVFMADHGEMLGERGDWYKMSFFEPAVTVPLILNAPRHVAPGRVSGSVSLLDLAPTLLDMANAPNDAELDGASLVPRLSARGARARTVVGEYLAEGAVAPVVMLREANLKFIHSPTDPDLLFDLDRDPDELHNLAGDPAHAADVKRFGDEVARRWDLPALQAQIEASQRRRRLIAAAVEHGAAPEWDYGDSDGPYVRGADFWAPFKKYRVTPA